MPITPAVPIRVFSQDEFHAVDKVVKGHAFAIHNEMGRFMDEKLYQNELATRLRNDGHHAESEVKVTLSLEDFTYDYYIDLLIDGGVIVEIKTASLLTPTHRAQILNYLYICGLNHGSLINFRNNRVETEFVSTKLTPQSRREFKINTQLWQPLSKSCESLLAFLTNALQDWGRGLNTSLYRDFISHQLGGKEKVVQEVSVFSNLGSVGKQDTHLLTEEIAFAVSSVTKDQNTIRDHQLRFLNHTHLVAIQWINMNRETISIETIKKS